MTYEEVKAIRQNPTVEAIDNEELSDMIDKAIDMAIALEKTYMDIKPFMSIGEWKQRIYEYVERENKYAWHDLRKDPEDLPSDNNKEYLCVAEHMGRYASDPPTVKDYTIMRRHQLLNLKEFVIAWREIEPFEEVE